MRRAFYILTVACSLAPTLARGEMVLLEAHQVQQHVHFRRFGGEEHEDPHALVREQLRQAFATERSPGMDDWAWRDAVEEKLVAMGPSAAYLFHRELDTRQGYEADALRTALFRLYHRIDPRHLLDDWAAKTFPRATVKLARILGKRTVLANHLFYAATVTEANSQSTRRLVIALAADGKVQTVQDDAALARFLALELPPARTDAARANAAELAALLCASRAASLYAADISSAAEPLRARAELLADGRRVRTALSFDNTGRLTALTSEIEGSSSALAAPALPDGHTPPPPPPSPE